jgi:hypothetical protein
MNLNDATKRRTLNIYNKHSTLGYIESFMGFHIHVVVNIKIFLDVMPCSSKDMYHLKMETADSSKMLVPVYQTIWHHIPEDYTLDIICHMYPSSTDLWIITWSHPNFCRMKNCFLLLNSQLITSLERETTEVHCSPQII